MSAPAPSTPVLMEGRTALQPELSQAFSVALPDWAVLRITGPDAPTFLHSQLTQSVTDLAEGQARLAGYCSAKGRLLATGWLLRLDAAGRAAMGLPADEPAFAWFLSADVLAGVAKRLQMFVLRAKCKVAQDPPAGRVWGHLTPGAAARPAGAAESLPVSLALPDAGTLRRALSWQPAEAAEDAASVRGAAGAASALDAEVARSVWAQAEVASGVPRVVAATQERFVPQMMNLELWQGVNFQKGCYPGQEVVARSQYRGTLKRRLYVAHCAQALPLGAEVIDPSVGGDDDPVVGEVALSAPGWAQVVLRIPAAGAGHGPLQVDGVPLEVLAQQPIEWPAAAG